MNEPIIHDSTPAGNAILAYGETSRPKRLSTILAVLTGLVLVFGIGVMLYTIFGATLPVPQDVALLTHVPSSVSLPSGSPRLWLDAQRQSKAFPLFVGLRISSDGKQQPFAITLRTFSGDKRHTSWIWQLLQNEETPFTLYAPRDFTPGWSESLSSAWLHVWPSRLLGTQESGLADGESFGGIITSDRWKTNLLLSTSVQEQKLLLGQNFIDLTTFPLAWSLVEPALQNIDLNLELTTEPSAAQWSVDETGESSVALDFQEAPNLQTKAELAASVGLFDREAYTLPDGTVVTENRLPLSTLNESTSTEWALDEGKEIVFEEKAVRLGATTLSSPAPTLPSHCQGRMVATFDLRSTQTILNRLLTSPLVTGRRVVLLEEEGNLVICW